MDTERLAQYGGRILSDGTLEMRDPNDNARHRYQYAIIDGVPSRRTLPDTSDYDPPSRWEPLDIDVSLAPNPMLDYLTSITIHQFTCNRCGGSWLPRRLKKPGRCPKCGSPYWNKTRVRNLKRPVA